MAVDERERKKVKTAEFAFKIIETLQEMDGASVTELANELGIAKSTAHRHLTTLEAREYITKEDNRYYVGLRFLTLGEYARNRKRAYQTVAPKVTAVAEKTKERAQFIVEEHGKAVYIHRETGENAVYTPDSGVGKRIPLYATSAGKAILAHYPKDEVDDIINQMGMPSLTKNTVTDRSELFKELEIVREKGYSTNLEENIEGIRAIGVPIKDTAGHPIGALSVSGPSHRMQGERFQNTIPDLLLGIAEELEFNITYSSEHTL